MPDILYRLRPKVTARVLASLFTYLYLVEEAEIADDVFDLTDSMCEKLWVDHVAPLAAKFEIKREDVERELELDAKRGRDGDVHYC